MDNVTGIDFHELGFKSMQMLRDIGALKGLLNLLLESDSINFHMRLMEVKQVDSNYSIFKFSDEETSNYIKQLESETRIYTVRRKKTDEKTTKSDDQSEDLEQFSFSKQGTLNTQNQKAWDIWESGLPDSLRGRSCRVD